MVGNRILRQNNSNKQRNTWRWKSLEIQTKTTLKPPERFQSQILSTGTDQKLDCNVSSALGQLRSHERRLAKYEPLNLKYSDSIKMNFAKDYISLLQKGELERQDVWYLPHHQKNRESRKSLKCCKKFLRLLPEKFFDERSRTSPKLNRNLVQVLRKLLH